MSSSRFPSLSSLALALSAAVVLTACAPNDEGAAPATADTLPTASAPAIRAHVEFLADDLLEGRLSGTRGYDIAAGYVASEFAQIGLRHGAADGGWLQPVGLVESLSLLPPSRLVLRPTTGPAVRMAPGKDFLPVASLDQAKVLAEAPVVFAGFGVSAPAHGHDDLAGIDVKGKVVLVFGGAPSTFPPEVRAHYSAGLTKTKALVDRGAVGILQIQTREDQQRTPWERLVQQSWRSRMAWADKQGVANGAWPQLAIRASISPDSAAALFAGAPRTLDEAYAAAEAGTPQAFELPLAVEQERHSMIRQRQSANVVGVLEGADPALKNEYVVISAHLDHVGKGAPIGGDAIYNGAFDNASGIAVMLEAARLLASSPVRPRRSVVFLAVTAEESGLQGADYFVQHPTVPREAIVANINIDMPVALAPLADVTAFGAENSTLGAVVERAAAAEGVAVTPDSKPEEVIFVRSDQYAFVRAGIPALYIDEGMRSTDPTQDQAARVEAFRKERYHQPGDDLSQAIDWPSLAMLARLNARVITEVANDDARPAWHPGNFFGETFAEPAASPPAPTP
ncbi:M28 family metallopeptidase [Silanimonas algicola]